MNLYSQINAFSIQPQIQPIFRIMFKTIISNPYKNIAAALIREKLDKNTIINISGEYCKG